MLNVGKISRAVTTCLDKCYVSPSPLAAVAEYVSGLSRDPDWSAYEVESVEIRVLRVLNRIVCESPPAKEGDAKSIAVRVNPAEFSKRRKQDV